MSENMIHFIATIVRTFVFVLTAKFSVYESSPLSELWRIVVLAVGMVAWTVPGMIEWRLLG